MLYLKYMWRYEIYQGLEKNHSKSPCYFSHNFGLLNNSNMELQIRTCIEVQYKVILKDCLS